MKQIVLNGWNLGMQRGELTKLLRREFGYSSSKAKSVTDTVLKKEEVRLPKTDRPLSDVLAEIQELGVVASIEDQIQRSLSTA